MYHLIKLEAALAETIFACKLHFTASTTSTNTDAMTAARNGAPHGSVYFADEQTAGRGRGNHGWHSAAGDGLYVSILLRPQLAASNLALLPLAAGLAAADAIHGVSALSVDLRWPNDLLIGERKVGGILVEARNDSKGPLHAMAVVVGVGINIHQRNFPPDLATPATSLDLELNRPVSRQNLLVALLKSLQRETSGLSDPAVANEIPARVELGSSWTRGRYVQVHGPQACEGVTVGLDNNAFLRVETAAGLVTIQTGGIRAALKK